MLIMQYKLNAIMGETTEMCLVGKAKAQYNWNTVYTVVQALLPDILMWRCFKWTIYYTLIKTTNT